MRCEINSAKFVSLPKAVSKNILVVAPTGSGKTTAVLRNLKQYTHQFSRVIICLPTKALMSEISRKLNSMGIRHLLDNSDARLTQNITLMDWLSNKVIVCSYEKAATVALSNNRILENSLVVIDEIHLILSVLRPCPDLQLFSASSNAPYPPTR